ncbi:hypothetical protein ACTFR8_23160 [Bacillus cereus group sp. MYBK15-3]|uniref:hypothetical protein n=1 Tax=unclassified Bacillus cereus group TaxID=2750818 RepID=UPI003F7A1C19
MFTCDFVKTYKKGLWVYLFKVKVKELLESCVGNEYNAIDNPTGYAAKVTDKHVRERAQKIESMGSIFLVLKTIMLATNKDTIRDLDTSVAFEADLRVVGGHLDVAALRYLINSYRKSGSEDDVEKANELREADIPVIVLAVGDIQNRIFELQAYISINERNKEMSVLRAKKMLRDLQGVGLPPDYRLEDVRKEFVTQISLYLTSADSSTVWSTAWLKGDVLDIRSMRESLLPVADKVIAALGDDVTSEDLYAAIDSVKYMVDSAWSMVNYEWGSASNYDKEIDEDYVLHKSLGMYVIHSWLADCICGFNVDADTVERKLENVNNHTYDAFRDAVKENKLDFGWEWHKSAAFGTLTLNDVDRVKHYIKHGEFPSE